MALTPKFLRTITVEECFSNEMVVPSDFCAKYGSSIPIGIKLRVRNGYELWVDFVKINQRFVGMRDLFKDFNLRGGESLMFENVGAFNFKVFIFSAAGSEIEYALVVHQLQGCLARKVVYPDDGWSFVNYRRGGHKPLNEVVPPLYFIENFAPMLPNQVEYVVSGGQHIVGSYCRRECELTGIGSLCHMLGVPHLNCLNVLLFTYDGRRTFQVAVFDKFNVEMPVSPSVSRNVPNGIAFEVLIQPYHMLEFCHGVGLSVDFRSITDIWGRKDHFTAYFENRCWRLEIRKRGNSKRTALHDGWIQFRDDMDLGIGDRCVFQWKSDSVRNFNVRIIRS